MKRLTTTLTLATTMALGALLTCALGSCTLETSDNGDLDGFWQLKSLDSLASNRQVDMRQERVFWAVQRRLLEARKPGLPVLFRFDVVGDSLFLSDPYVDFRDSADIKVVDPAMLAPLGINALDEHFAIKALNSDNMVLESNVLRLYFRKY